MHEKVVFKGVNNNFHHVLKQRVENYFKENKISEKANFSMVLKTIVLLAAAVALYTWIVFYTPQNVFAILGLCFSLAFVLAGIGFGVQHDANHGAYSSNHTVNKLLGYTLDLLGGSSYMWKIKHNINHHTYTNIEGFDDDIAKHPVFRFSPAQELKWFHKYQFLYWIPMYALSSILWVFFNDFHKYFKGKIVKTTLRKMSTSEKVEFWTLKLTSYFIFLAIPIYVHGPIAILFFFLMHFFFGYIISLVFQLAHCIEELHFPMPNDKDIIEQSWAAHQIETTANFATDNKFLNWYVGGLNFQIEHHLFPRICHVHYPKIAPLVEQTCEEFNLKYVNYKTFWGSYASHVRHLKNLGRA